MLAEGAVNIFDLNEEAKTLTGNTHYSLEKVDAVRRGATTQAETRVYNERLILTLIRKYGALSKVELTRLTGLSPQSMTSIVNRISDAGLLTKHEPLRGGLGQPSTPYGLNPEGAFSYGLTISSRSANFTLVNLLGEQIAFDRIEFDYPTPKKIMDFAKKSIKNISRSKKAPPLERIAGLGIASPFQIWSRNDTVGKPATDMMEWQQVDVRHELQKLYDWPVYLFSDGMVATAAEIMFGKESDRADFLYAYIGYFLTGGLVLDNHLFPGRRREAGALGFLPLNAGKAADPKVSLLDAPSLSSLAKLVGPARCEQIWASPDNWVGIEKELSVWIDNVSTHLAFAASSAAALIDINSFVVDGAIPEGVRSDIASAVRSKLSSPLQYRTNFEVAEGSFGHMSPVLGGASIPLMVKYSTDKDLLFKTSL